MNMYKEILKLVLHIDWEDDDEDEEVTLIIHLLF